MPQIDKSTWKSIEHLTGCCEAWIEDHIPAQETIGMYDDIARVKEFLRKNQPKEKTMNNNNQSLKSNKIRKCIFLFVIWFMFPLLIVMIFLKAIIVQSFEAVKYFWAEVKNKFYIGVWISQEIIEPGRSWREAVESRMPTSYQNKNKDESETKHE